MSASFRILVVEDNEANQLLAQTVLERDGFAVDLASTTTEARERLTTRHPDLILLDIQLPGQDGLSFARQLKSDLTTASIPIVALTALAMAGDREEALAAGCDGYIAKPIDTRTLGEQVRRYLPPGIEAMSGEGE